MSAADLGAKLAQTKVLEVKIKYIPGTGQLAVQWPSNDMILNLGLLEWAKQALAAQQLKQELGMGEHNLVVAPANSLKV